MTETDNKNARATYAAAPASEAPPVLLDEITVETSVGRIEFMRWRKQAARITPEQRRILAQRVSGSHERGWIKKNAD